MFKNILHPNQYQGFHANPPYFEGWYYKMVSADESSKFAVIPGVYIAKVKENSHCFVQVFDSEMNQVTYHRYPYERFSASRESFEIIVGPNSFYADHIHLDINENNKKIKGSLSFKSLNPWPVKFSSPGAMGWFAWVPFMQTYHGVVSMDHVIEGSLLYDGIEHDFSNGRGYIEKDWGKMFPSAYIWGQSNHFKTQGVSIMISVAVIPWLGFSFGGFIVGLLHDGQLHRFATYNRSKIEHFEVGENLVEITVRNPTHRLKVRATRSEGGSLQAPTATEMDRRIIETLDARFEIQFEENSGKIIYKGIGENAGLEIVGDMTRLAKMV